MRINSSYIENDAILGKKCGIAAGVGNSAGSSKCRVRQTAVYLAVLMLTGWMANSVMAEPTGSDVKSGSATINKSGIAGQSTTTVTQTSDSLSLEWQSFNLGKNETVNFVQPSKNAVAINRILSATSGILLSAEWRELLPPPPESFNVKGQWIFSVFADAGIVKINQQP